jgi:arylsulfatase A-like enzyme
MLGSQGLDFKNEPYEESARIPLLIRYPRAFPAGERNSTLISNVDYMPTLLGLCGAEIPESVQGLDHSALLTAGAGSRPASIFAEGKMAGEGEWRMVVRGYDKLVVDRHGEVTHQYNLSNDPYEMNNLKDSREQRLTRDALLALLNDWRKRTGDGRTASGLRSRG